jgi:hypothetical protein
MDGSAFFRHVQKRTPSALCLLVNGGQDFIKHSQGGQAALMDGATTGSDIWTRTTTIVPSVVVRA